MPRVPMLEQPQVAQRPLPTPYNNTQHTPRQHSQAVGVGLQNLGASIGQASQAFAHVVAQEREKANKTRADLADIEFGGAINETLYNEQTGYLRQQGVHAVTAGPSAEEALEKARAKIAAGLANDEQRHIFNMRAAGRQEQATAIIKKHGGAQGDVVRGQAAEGQMGLALKAAAAEPGDVTTVRGNLLKALVDPDGSDGSAVRYWKDTLGMPPERIAVEIDAYMAKGYGLALDQLLARNDGEAALQFFSQVKDQLGLVGPKYAAAIQETLKSQAAESTAISIVNSARNVNGWVDAGQALAALDQQLPPGPMKDDTRTRLQHRLAAEENLKKAAVDRKANEALSYFQKGGRTLSAVPGHLKAWLQDPDNDPDAWERLVKLQNADRQAVANAPPTADQIRSLGAFLVDAASRPEHYATMSVEEFNSRVLPFLARTDWDKASGVLASLRKQANQPDKLSPIEERMVLKRGREAGVFPEYDNNPANWTDEEFAVFYRIHEVLSEKAAQHKKTNGKPAPPELLQQWTDEQFTKVKIPNSGWFSDDETTRIQQDMKGDKPKDIRPRRTVNGETRVWNGKAWVREDQ